MDYLNLLMTQLRYQDPMDPMDNSEMTMQLTQMGQLEQLNNLSTSFQGALSAAQKSQAAALIGREVTFRAADGSGMKSGRVESVEMDGDDVYLCIGDDLQYTRAGLPADESVKIDELEQASGLRSTDTVTIYGIKPDGSAVNSGNGAQIGLHNGWDYITVGDLLDEIDDVLAVDGQETYAAELKDGVVSIRNVYTGEPVRTVQLVYNGSGRLSLPDLARPYCNLSDVASISE
jgi:flagellar basal-body rod modification protein FlgD